MRINSFIIILLFGTILFSCTEENGLSPELDLIGTWGKTREYNGVKEVFMIRFERDSSFVISNTIYGGWTGLTINELNGKLEYPGKAIIDGTQIEFPVEELIFTDYRNGAPPQTRENKTIFFDDCTYEVRGDTLFLNYTSYPADFPEPASTYLLRSE